MSGISRRNFALFRSLCGEQTLRNVIIVTNMWGEVAEAVGAARERELATDVQLFQSVLRGGARMMRHYNTLESAQTIIRSLIDSNPVVLQIQAELVDENRRLEQTKAGQQIESEAVAEQRRKQEAETQEKQKAKEAAFRAQQEQRAQELARAQKAKAEEEARARAAEAQRVAQQAQEEERLRAVQRELAAQAEARRREEERVQTLQRELAAQAEARRIEQERMRQVQAQIATQEPHVVAKVEREINRIGRRLRKGRLF
ncbi:hypothetical protein EIP86_009194 [Pleurotus ostreatoroseus]|nr:hypothetical protein EIP86_009194 [Pleurotus ostreatoroseus]